MQKLGDIATYINGYAFKPADRGLKGLPIIRIQDLTGNSYDLGFYDGIYPKKIEINNGDILISWSGSLGIFLWNGGKALLNQHIFKVVFDKKDIDKHYFLFAVKEKLNEMSLKTHGATMKHIIKSDFENITISLPDLNEQKRISNMLLKIENLIKMRKNQIQHYDTLTKSLFVEMFINENYTKKKLGECAIINPKKSSDKRLHDELEVSFVPMMAVGGNGHINVSEIKKLADVKNGFTYFSEGDVLFAKITPCMENGKGAIASNLCNGIGFGSTEFHVIRPIENITTSEWIYVLTTLQKFRLSAEANMTGSAGQKRVPASFLQDYSFYLPPIELQKQFSRVFKHLDKHKSVIQKSLDETQLLFDSLMQKYFG